VALPGVAEILDPVHELRRGLLWRGNHQPVAKASMYCVINSVWILH